MSKKTENVLLSNASLQFCFGQIALNDLGRLLVFLDKHTRGRAAAERFNSKCPAAREQIEDARASDRVAQAGKDSGLDAVHCRSHTALGNRQTDPAGAAGDHSHGDATGVGVPVPSGSAFSDGAEGVGEAGIASSSGFLFFFGRSLFPPKKLLIILLRSRPTSRSIKFVLGRSTVPLT